MKKFFLKYKFSDYEYLAIAIIAIIYYKTAARSVLQIDCGELAAVQYHLGIAHPTGYPLFSLLGHLFLKLKLVYSPIFQLNLLAAIYCLIAVAFFIKSINFILRHLNSLRFESNRKEIKIKAKTKSSQQQENKKIAFNVESINFDTLDFFGFKFAIIVASSTFALGLTFWSQAIATEVYSLNIAILSIALFFLLKLWLQEDGNDNLNLILFSLFIGLGFANHMSIMFILPSFLWALYNKYGLNKKFLAKAATSFAVVFIVMVSFYVYLMIRANQKPLFIWGNPVDFERLFRHVTAKQYRVWLFESFDAYISQLVKLFKVFLKEYFYIGFVITVAGVYITFKKYRKLWIFLSWTLVFTFLYASGYNIVDIDSYLLPAIYAAAFFLFFGYLYLAFVFKEKRIVYFILAIAAVVAIYFVNLKNNDSSDVRAFEDYTKTILGSVEDNSLILSYQWDYFISPSYYYKFVEGFRKDVRIVDTELLKRSWYYAQLERFYPGILKNLRKEINEFLAELLKFERGEKYDALFLERRYQRIKMRLIEEALNEGRNVYMTIEVLANEINQRKFALPEGYAVFPHMILFKVAPSNSSYVAAPEPDFRIRRGTKSDPYIDFIFETVPKVMLERTKYEISVGNLDMAKLYYGRLIKQFPRFKINYDEKIAIEKILKN